MNHRLSRWLHWRLTANHSRGRLHWIPQRHAPSNRAFKSEAKIRL